MGVREFVVWHGLSSDALIARLKERLWLKCLRRKQFAIDGSPCRNGSGQHCQICVVSPGNFAIGEKTTI